MKPVRLVAVVLVTTAIAMVVATIVVRPRFLPRKELELHSIQGGGYCGSGGFAVSSPSVVVVPRMSPVIWGTRCSPRGEIELAYLVFVRVPRPFTSTSGFGPFESEVASGTASAHVRLALNGRAFDLVDACTLDPATGQFGSEVLSIDGNSVTLTAGRVFLVDLMPGGGPTEQLSIDVSGLPSTNGDDVDATERCAKAMLGAARGESPRVAAFVEEP